MEDKLNISFYIKDLGMGWMPKHIGINVIYNQIYWL